MLLASTAACSHGGDGDDVYDNPNKDEAGVFETSDLSLFELPCGSVLPRNARALRGSPP